MKRRAASRRERRGRLTDRRAPVRRRRSAVAEVTKGARLAAVGWARSFIRDPTRRELLFDLDTARQALFMREGKTAELDLLSKTSANLLRMWAED